MERKSYEGSEKGTGGGRHRGGYAIAAGARKTRIPPCPVLGRKQREKNGHAHLRIHGPARGRKLEVDIAPLQDRVRLDAVDVPAQRGKTPSQRAVDAIQGYPHPFNRDRRGARVLAKINQWNRKGVEERSNWGKVKGRRATLQHEHLLESGADGALDGNISRIIDALKRSGYGRSPSDSTGYDGPALQSVSRPGAILLGKTPYFRW